MHDNTLSFLDNILGSRADFYRTSRFLESDFDEDVWVLAVNASRTDAKTRVDWRIVMSDGSMLTDPKNRPLLNMFKFWINATIHPDNTEGRGLGYAMGTAYNLISSALYTIDYFLLNDHHFKLHLSGLEGITGDDFKILADRIFHTKKAAESIYEWSKNLSNYLMNKVETLSNEEYLEITSNTDVDFEEITNEQIENNELHIPLDKVAYARVWLWKEGYYRRGKNENNYIYVPKTTALSKALYGTTTLKGSSGPKPWPEILCLKPQVPDAREFPAVPTKSDIEDSISLSGGRKFQKAIRAINLLRDREFHLENLPLPTVESVEAFVNFSTDSLHKGRFTTVPSSIIFESINNAVQFHIKYASHFIESLDSILKLYSEKLRDITEEQSEKIQELLSQDEFIACLSPKIKKLGIERWGLDHKRGDASGRRAEELRSNKAFANLIRVYYGGAALIIGALMARRQAELDSLYASSCLDDTERYMLFRKAKSTSLLEGKRSLVARPIDEMGVEMIKVLKEIQELFLKYGFITKTGKLFDAPSIQHANEFQSIDNYQQLVHQSIDFFCDYFEVPLNKLGQRYYIRQHQLRRFFALSFFWGSGFGGMDTLRWFLGHTDAQHLYHYITETSPGAVLVHAKAQFLAETIDEHKELKELLSKRYGTSDFTILETDELEDYISQLIDSGEVQMEPDFFEDDDGNKYELVVTVREKTDG